MCQGVATASPRSPDSEISHADAIDRAVERASKTLRHLAWVEVKEQRGEIENGKIRHYQVILKDCVFRIKTRFDLKTWTYRSSVAFNNG